MGWNETWRGPWARVLGGAVASLFLVPVPALALMFMGPWQVVQNVHSMGIPAAIVQTFTDSSNGRGPLGIVEVNMGDTTNVRASGSSSVVIQRKFAVNAAGGESLSFLEDFSSQLKNGTFAISASIGHFRGSHFVVDYSYPTVSGSADNKVRTFSDGYFVSPTLGQPGQTYYLTLNITYTKEKDGFWRDHPEGHHHKSHHHFEFGRA